MRFTTSIRVEIDGGDRVRILADRDLGRNCIRSESCGNSEAQFARYAIASAADGPRACDGSRNGFRGKVVFLSDLIRRAGIAGAISVVGCS